MFASMLARETATNLTPGTMLAEGEVMDVFRGDGFVRVTLEPSSSWRVLEFDANQTVTIFP